MNILKKNIKFLFTLFLLLGLSFNTDFVYAAGSDSSSGGNNGEVSLYKSGKKLVYRAKKLEAKGKNEKAKNYT